MRAACLFKSALLQPLCVIAPQSTPRNPVQSCLECQATEPNVCKTCDQVGRHPSLQPASHRCTLNCWDCSTDSPCAPAANWLQRFFKKGDGSCGACGANCAACSSATQCTQPDPGFYVHATGASVPCRVAYHNKCLTCTAGAGCTSCESGDLKQRTLARHQGHAHSGCLHFLCLRCGRFAYQPAL